MTAHEISLKIISEKDSLTVEELERLIKQYATECIDRFNKSMINIGI